MFLVNDAPMLCFHVVVFIAPGLLEFLYMCLFYEDSLHPIVLQLLLKKLSLIKYM